MNQLMSRNCWLKDFIRLIFSYTVKIIGLNCELSLTLGSDTSKPQLGWSKSSNNTCRTSNYITHTGVAACK